MTRAILRRLELLREYVAFLCARQHLPLDALRDDPEVEAAVERYLSNVVPRA